MNNLTKLSKISYVVDILQQAREKLLEATTIINTDKRDEVMETITSAIDEVYDLLEKEGQVKWNTQFSFGLMRKAESKE